MTFPRLLTPLTRILIRPSSRIVGIALFLASLLPALSASAEDLPLWLIKTKLSGDFRYRHEGIDAEGGTASYRNRIRYRLGIENTVNDKVKVGARFASSTGDPRSTNIDLKDGLESKPFALDRAYFELSPCKSAWLTAGRFGIPFVTTDAHWDGDVNWEGMAGKLKRELGATTVSLAGAGVWLKPYKSKRSTQLFAGQIAANGKFAGDATWQANLAMYHYQGVMDDFGYFGNALDVATDTTFEDTTYSVSSDTTLRASFRTVDAVFGITVPVQDPMKVSVTVNPILNTATSKDNLGWLAMIKVKSKLLNCASSLSYDYRVLEADAVFGAFTDSDAAGGRTNQRGHRIMADCELLDGFTVGGSAYLNTLSASGDGNWYQRWMLDGVVKF